MGREGVRDKQQHIGRGGVRDKQQEQVVAAETRDGNVRNTNNNKHTQIATNTPSALQGNPQTHSHTPTHTHTHPHMANQPHQPPTHL